MGNQTQAAQEREPTEASPLDELLLEGGEKAAAEASDEAASQSQEGTPASPAVEADAESPGELSPEQIAALARDERVRRHVLAAETGGQSIDELVNRILVEREEAERQAKVAEEQQKTLLDAVRKAEDPETPDFEELGRIAYQTIRKQREVAPVVHAAVTERTREFLAAMDDATDALGLSDAAAALSQEERQALARLLQQGDLRRFVTESFRRLREKDAALRQGRALEKDVEAAARTAARARGGPAGLPPGKPSEPSPLDVDIVDYLRERM